jgi:hypothetical protein
MYVNIWYKYIIGYTMYNIYVFHTCVILFDTSVLLDIMYVVCKRERKYSCVWIFDINISLKVFV